MQLSFLLKYRCSVRWVARVDSVTKAIPGQLNEVDGRRVFHSEQCHALTLNMLHFRNAAMCIFIVIILKE
jgi:hypothetical protein